MTLTLSRREFVNLALGGAAACAIAPVALADAYPTRPVRLVVGFPAGTSSDITARLVGQWLSRRLGQQFIVENRTGAGTNIAADSVVHASPDGYSLLWVTQTNTINTTLYDKLDFNFSRDIAPVAGIMRVPAVMMVHSSVPAQTVPEFIAYAKANPGKINMSSPGIGSVNHILGELFMMMAGVKLVHVSYRSSQFPDLLAGQVHVTFNPTPSSLDFIRAGKLRALAVTSVNRQEVLPGVPTVGETVPGYEGYAWFGIGAPKDTPAPIVERLNREINAGLADPQLKGRLVELGGVPMPMSTGDFAKFIASETEKWAKVVAFSGAKPE